MATTKSKVLVNGVIVGGNGLNVEEAKRSVRTQYEVADKYGKSNTVLFEEGEGFVCFVVTQA